ncbi:hypothetical protein WJX74_003798 [Apatococcus lobatus]|uniref:Aminoglycoside phosphotransferase domain-containing protein n=1 Tax=Apatococcus lobatus TaxID=904363 RepID=A0AAW1Q6V7_9CHLO
MWQAVEEHFCSACESSPSSVHGDLRSTNIFVRENAEQAWEVQTIDFDLAGVEGVATYPPFLNHRHISWPEGVIGGAKIVRAHDCAHIEQIISRPPACARPSQHHKQQVTVSQAHMVRINPHLAPSWPSRPPPCCSLGVFSRQWAHCDVRL